MSNYRLRQLGVFDVCGAQICIVHAIVIIITLYRTLNQRRPRSSLTEPLFVRKALKMRRGGSGVVSLVKPTMIGVRCIAERPSARECTDNLPIGLFTYSDACYVTYARARMRLRCNSNHWCARFPAFSRLLLWLFFLLKNQIYDIGRL